MQPIIAMQPQLRFIGVASALGAPVGTAICPPGQAAACHGPAAGPAALRRLGLAAAPRRAGIEAIWAASIEPPACPSAPAAAGHRAALQALLGEVAEEVAATLAGGGLPVVVGGDHSIAAGTWRGVGRAIGQAPGLIWIDAHLDAHTPASSLTGNWHGMPLAALFGLGDPAMTGLAGPSLMPARVVALGARSYEAAERQRLSDLGVRVIDAADIDRRGLAACFAEALAIAGADGQPFGVSLDLDAIDPAAAPGVTTPAADGLDAGELRQVLTGLLRERRCVALEIAEYCPDRDPRQQTGRLVVDLLEAACLPAAAELMRWESRYGANNYAPLPVVLSEGRGCWLTDSGGRRYLDLMSAYSAVSLGHGHPRLLAALTAQASRLAVTSRAYGNDRLPLLLRRLTELTGYQRALPVNTGLEAVETALKAARKWAYQIKGVAAEQAEIIACNGNFHGRSISIVGLSSEAQYRDGFGPFPAGLKRVPYGDIDALAAAITPNTAAFLVEPIQGEGGIIMPPPGYLAACAELCRRERVLLIADEVQTALGRTGYLLASQHDGIRPDAVILGKALGGGLLPVSAFLADEAVMQVFTPGDHGSTFGGNPLAAAVALEALDVLIDEGLIEHAAELGLYLQDRLLELARHTPCIRAVRGRGLFAGIEVDPARADAHTLALRLLEQGVLTKDTHATVLRLAPPLVITEDELDWGLARLEAVFAAVHAYGRPHAA